MIGSDVRKVLLFGVLGAVGCLAGWLVGELFLWACLPANKETGGSLASKPVLPAPANRVEGPDLSPPALADADVAFKRARPALPPPDFQAVATVSKPAPPPEFAQRLEKAKAKSGDVQITLIWSNYNDLDLHCIEPSREEIFYAHRKSRTGGELDVDMNGGGPMTKQPVENIYWPPGKAPHGKYKVYVDHYANQGGKDPTKYKVSILVGNRRQEFTGEISSRQPKRLITEFEVTRSSFETPNEPDLRLAVSPELIVNQGNKNELKIRIGRKNLKGPVSCRFAGDLNGLAAPEFTIADNETEAAVEISADGAAALGARTLTVAASAGKTTAEASFKLTVSPPPPELRLAVSPAIVVNQGYGSRMRIRLARSGLTGQVRVRLGGDLDGITPKELTVAETETDITAEIQAAAGAPLGDRTLKVIANVGDTAAETSFQLTVNRLPPVLRLALPREIRISPTGQSQLPVRIARDRFKGPVFVRLEGDLAGLSPQEFSISAENDDADVMLTAAGASLGTREIRVIASSGDVRSEGTLQVIVASVGGPQWSWQLVIVIALWTALLTLGLSLALVMGQNWYLSRPVLSLGEFALVFVGGVTAGVIAGGIGQTLYGLLMQIHLLPALGFLAGWVLLGCLLGRGLVFFIPNLSAWRAVAAGSGGGFLGAAAFLIVSFIAEPIGRFMGAAILGLALGLMVAIVETAFRKSWLEVVDSDGAVRVVNLGATPVFIGGDPRRCTVVVAGAPMKALKFWEQDGQVYCLDILTERTSPVSPGYRHPLKSSEVVVCSGNGKQAKPEPSSAPVPQDAVQVKKSKPGAERSALPVAKVAPPPKVVPAPNKDSSAASVVGPCPICGVQVKGLVGQRRCKECWTAF